MKLSFKAKHLKDLTLILIMFLSVSLQHALANKYAYSYCYSAYHLSQNLNLEVSLGNSRQKQKIQLDILIHTKEIDPPENMVSKVDENVILRSYIMMLLPDPKSDSLTQLNISEKYRHPFMVHTNGKTGEFLDIESTETQQSTIDDYITYYDLFQYSKKAGNYRYRNVNGFYNSEITQADQQGIILKSNKGYLAESNRINVRQSEVSIRLNKLQNDCFYYSSKGEEKTETHFSKNAYVDANAHFTIVSKSSLALPKNHQFFLLSSQLSSWPSFENKREISEEIAKKELLSMIEELVINIDNKPKILTIMKSNKELWPFLPEYISENSVGLDLIGKIFWALDVTDSTASVSALASMAVNASDNVSYKAIMALISTSASLDEGSLELLKNKVVEMAQAGDSSQNSLLLVRAIGILANRRIVNSPNQSEDLKQFLYQQVEMSEGKLQVSLLKSIGALGDNIDEDGITILMTSLESESNEIVQASLVALEKIPYDQQYSDQFVSQLRSEKNQKTKHRLIELLGNTSITDQKVKDQLISLAGNSKNPNDRKLSLNSLKKIGYDFQIGELSILEAQLRHESDKTNQKLLASLILKARRNQKKY